MKKNENRSISLLCISKYIWIQRTFAKEKIDVLRYFQIAFVCKSHLSNVKTLTMVGVGWEHPLDICKATPSTSVRCHVQELERDGIPKADRWLSNNDERRKKSGLRSLIISVGCKLRTGMGLWIAHPESTSFIGWAAARLYRSMTNIHMQCMCQSWVVHECPVHHLDASAA